MKNNTAHPGPSPSTPVHVVVAVGVLRSCRPERSRRSSPRPRPPGTSRKITNSTNTTATAPYFKCSDAEAADKSTALFQYS